MSIVEIADLIWSIVSCLAWAFILIVCIAFFVWLYRLPKLPCKVGDALYVVRESDTGEFSIESVRVCHFTVSSDGNYIVTVTDEGYFESYDFDVFNEEIFCSEIRAKHEIVMMKGKV